MIALFAIICVSTAYAQQDPQYSEYMFNQFSINPAYAGSRGVLSGGFLFRDQWVNIPGAPQTQSFSLQSPLRRKKVGLGIQMLADEIGPVTNTAVLGTYAYSIHLGRGRLAMGVRYGLRDYMVDWSKITYKDHNDIYYSNNKTQKLIQDADAGIYYHTESFYWGFAYNHLITQKATDQNGIIQTGADYKPHLYATFGKGFQISRQVILNPSLLIKSGQNTPPSADINMNVLLDQKLWLGLSVRLDYGFVFLTEYDLSSKLKLGYSYDAGVNKIGQLGGGSHELTIVYSTNIFRTRVVSPRYL